VKAVNGSTMLLRCLAVPAAALAFASPVAASADGGARVWIADRQPLVVRGSGFHPAAQITVVVTKAKRTFRTATVAGASGAFTARFHADLPMRCDATLVTATDTDRQRAVSAIPANPSFCGGMRTPPVRH